MHEAEPMPEPLDWAVKGLPASVGEWRWRTWERRAGTSCGRI